MQTFQPNLRNKMKRLFTIILIVTSCFNSDAQDSSFTKMILEDSAFQKRLDSLGLLNEVIHDDRYLQGMLPLIFGSNGYYFYYEFAKKFDRVNFYRNSLEKMTSIHDYYQNHIKGFVSDSMVTKHYTTDFGDLKENYIFFYKGKKIRLISLYFNQSVQLQSWDDETEFIPRTIFYRVKDDNE